MTEVAERVELKDPLAEVSTARVEDRPSPDRLSEPDWVDWCDADR